MLTHVASESASPALAPPIVHEVIRSSGAPLDRAVADSYTPRLGYDLSQVRVHSNGRAAESARLLGADAYTVGDHIVLGAPPTESLVAHELVHVAQWGGRPIPERLAVGAAAGAAEREASGPCSQASESTTSLQRAVWVCDEQRQRPSGKVKPGPGLAVGFSDRVVTVDAQLHLFGAEADEAKAAEARTTIQKNWNGAFPDGYSITTRVRVTHAGEPAPDAIEIELARRGDRLSATKRHWLMGSKYVALNLDEGDAFSWTIAHEFGHLIGLADRYDEGIISQTYGRIFGKRESTPKPGYENNIMAVVGGRLESSNVRDLITRHAQSDCVRGHFESPA